MKNTLITLCLLLLGATSYADTDWEAVQSGMFTVEFEACSADHHAVTVQFRMTNYSPMDQIPDGYFPATKTELASAAKAAFPGAFNPQIALASDSAITAPGFLSDIAMNAVPDAVDENGEPTPDISVVNLAMNNTKALLMKSGKYSGMGINYLESKAEVSAAIECR